MTAPQFPSEAHLSQVWDDLVNGTLTTTPIDPDAQFISRLHAQLALPAPSAKLEEAIWASVASAAVASLAETPQQLSETRPSLLARVLALLPAIAWAMIAGGLGGFIAGIVSRISMRLSGLLTIEANRFLHTDADATVGRFTLGGTLFLGGLGASAGLLTVGFYVLIRSRLPFTGMRRSLVFATILFLVFGYVLMDPTNPDYHRFGPAWINVTSFSLLYFVMGITVAELYERRPRAFSPARQRSNPRWLQVLTTPIYLALIGAGLFFALITIIFGAMVLLIPAVALGVWLVAQTGIHRRLSFTFVPMVVRQWGVLVVPGVVGVILTARGITEILLN